MLVVPLWHPLQLQVIRKREAEMGKYCKQRSQLDLIVTPTIEWPELALISLLYQKDEKGRTNIPANNTEQAKQQVNRPFSLYDNFLRRKFSYETGQTQLLF